MSALLTSESIPVTHKAQFNSEIRKLDFTAHCLFLHALLPSYVYVFSISMSVFSLIALNLIIINAGALVNSIYHLYKDVIRNIDKGGVEKGHAAQNVIHSVSHMFIGLSEKKNLLHPTD